MKRITEKINTKQKYILLFFVCMLAVSCRLSTVSSHVYALGTFKPTQQGGLIGHWTLDASDISGTIAYDRSGQGNNGTIANSPTQVNGKIGQAFNLNGSNQHIRRASFSGQPTGNNPRTITAWIKPSTGYSGANVIAFFGQDSGSPNGYGMYVTSAYKIEVEFDSGNGAVISNTTLSPNTWYFVTATYNGSTNSVYINGVFDNSVSYSSATTQAGEVDIGQWSTGGSHFNGSIDDVRIYNRALSAAEIGALYRATAGKANATQSATKLSNATGPIAHWSFDANAMTNATATDVSGNNNHASIVGSIARTIGKIGQGLSFDRVDDYATESAIDLSGTNVASVAFWLYKTDFADAGAVLYEATTNTNLSTTGFVMSYNDPGTCGLATRIELNIRGNNTGVQSGNNTACYDSPTIPGWHHYVGIFNKGNASNEPDLYIDGVLQTAVSRPNNSNNTNNFGNDPHFIMSRNGGLLGLGKLDDVRVYNRRLSNDEIKKLYTAGGGKANVSPTLPLSSGLVGHWTFDGKNMTNATATDSTANRNDGTLTNNPTRIMGQIGQALAFNGSTQNITVSTPPTTVTNNWTMSAWINPASLNQQGIAVSNGSDNGAAGDGYAFGIANGQSGAGPASSGDKLQGLFSGVAFINTGYTFPKANAWYHVVMTRNSGTTRFYVNGVQTANTSAAVPTTPTVFYIGSQTNTRYFNGKVDDVRIYNRALSPTEILQLYNLGGR